VARGLAVDEVPKPIAAMRLDEREIGGQRVLEHVRPAREQARLLAFGEERAVAGRSEEGSDARARRADALGEIALRHHLQLYFPRPVERVEDERIGLSRKRADHLAHAARFEQRGETRLAL